MLATCSSVGASCARDLMQDYLVYLVLDKLSDFLNF